MDRWMRWMMMYQDSVNTPGEAGSGGGSEEEEEEETPNLNSSPPQTGIESGFTNERLRQMSPREIEQLIMLQEQALRDAQRKNQEPSGGNTPPTPQPQTQVEPEEDVEPAEFWGDPLKHIRAENEKTLKRLQAQLDETIKPFKENLAIGAREQAWNEFYAKHPDGSRYRVLIENGLDQINASDDPTVGTIEMVYYTIKGKLADAGKSIEDLTGGIQTPRITPTDSILNPQHRPSSHPSRSEGGDTKLSRELSENEKFIARQRWPNLPAKEAYARHIALGELDEGDVVNSTIGLEKK